MIKIGKMLDTERGILYIDGTCDKEEAKRNGYAFAFRSNILNCELYQKKVRSDESIKHFVVAGD